MSALVYVPIRLKFWPSRIREGNLRPTALLRSEFADLGMEISNTKKLEAIRLAEKKEKPLQIETVTSAFSKNAQSHGNLEDAI